MEENVENKNSGEEVKAVEGVDGLLDKLEENSVEEKAMEEVVDDGMVVDIPDIMMPDEVDKNFDVVEDEPSCKTAVKVCFIGCGQAGSRLAETFWKLGYRRVCAINTTDQDLKGIQIPEENKLLLPSGEGGAGKDPEKGKIAAEKCKEEIYDLMRKSFGKKFDRIIVSLGAGGGSGTGSTPVVINIAKRLCIDFAVGAGESRSRVGAIVTLPMSSEGQRVNFNGYYILNYLFKLQPRDLTPMLIVDNDKIQKLYPQLSVTDFWKTANDNIAHLIHLFNTIADKDSPYTPFDRNEMQTLMSSGVVAFGAMPIKDWKSDIEISKAIREQLKKNVLASVDISKGNVAGCIFIGHKKVFDEIPQSHLEHGFDMLSRIMMENSTVHRGIYQGNREGLACYTIIGGLQEPVERMKEMKRLGQIQGDSGSGSSNDGTGGPTWVGGMPV